MKYSQYPYKRIDLETFQKEVEVMINDFKSAFFLSQLQVRPTNIMGASKRMSDHSKYRYHT